MEGKKSSWSLFLAGSVDRDNRICSAYATMAEGNQEEQRAAAAAAAERLWVASIVVLSRIPPVGSEVLYFPRGHGQHWPALPPPPEDHGDGIPCVVTSIERFTNGERPCARISLLPRAGNDPLAPPAGINIPIPVPGRFVFCSKVITDTDHRTSSFRVRIACAQLFPALENEEKLDLVVEDLRGNAWTLTYLRRGQVRSLCGDWGKFVSDKGAKAGDTIVFIRCPDERILVELRHDRNVPPEPLEELTVALPLAMEGSSFNVTYYPDFCARAFVVPRVAVEEAAGRDWEVGMEVRLRPKDQVFHLEQEAIPMAIIRGTVSAILPPGPATWRSMQVTDRQSTN